MEAPSQSAAQEAKALNVTLEREGDEFIAVLPPHPDLKDDESLGFPAPSEQEALDEARAFRSIEQSKVFKFEYDEEHDQYVVSFADKTFFGKYLAPTYANAQKAYAEFINTPEPPKAAEPTPEQPKQRRKRTSNGGSSNITSGIGPEPGQLPPPEIQTPAEIRAKERDMGYFEVSTHWADLDQRITRLENVLRDAITATAKALEELKNR